MYHRHFSKEHMEGKKWNLYGVHLQNPVEIGSLVRAPSFLELYEGIRQVAEKR